MLDRNEIPYGYREYSKNPLDADEIRSILKKLGLPAREVLRTRDKAFEELGLTGDESDEVLVTHMAAHPTLIQRPIGVLGSRAVIGRPPSKLVDLVREA